MPIEYGPGDPDLDPNADPFADADAQAYPMLLQGFAWPHSDCDDAARRRYWAEYDRRQAEARAAIRELAQELQRG